jgi:hypothetical protein
MGSNGNIIKISNGQMSDVATQAHTSFAKTVEANAASKIHETSADGVIFGEPAEATVLEDAVNIRVGMFFDGTGNNRKNVGATEPGWKMLWQDDTSYLNDRTNVDNLEKVYPKKTLYFSIYIEGIGTTDEKYDSLADMGLGTGDTGIRAKVRKGCELAAENIKKHAAGKAINIIIFDVFGFSRGAAAARNFVYEVTKPKYKATMVEGVAYDADFKMASQEEFPARGHLGLFFEKQSVKFNSLQIGLAGLYDTVASYGANHDDDYAELHLNAVSRAKKIVHLTAADEHREKFRLSSVPGHDISLPGVHSDVGGSYQDNVIEKVSLAEEMLSVVNREKIIQAEKNRLITQGWYREKQFSRLQPYKLTGTRTLSNKYSRIPLHLMVELGKTEVPFDEGTLNNQYSISATPLKDSTLKLTDVYARLKAYAVDKTKPALLFNNPTQLASLKNMVDHGAYSKAAYDETVKDADMLFELRNKYLHFSASWDGVGKEPELNKQNVRERKVYP